MVIKFENIMYIISQNGEVLVDNGMIHLQITLSTDDFQVLQNIFKEHEISVYE